MKSPGVTLAVIVVFLWNCMALAEGQHNPERVRLADIQTITAQRGRYVNARRGSPIPQMKCVGGSAGCKYEPSSMQCYNRGWDGRSVQWECKADLDERVKFGTVHVSCEGFNYPGDEYVLAGSCGVEYTLETTEKGQKPHGDGRIYPSLPKRDHPSDGWKVGSIIGSLISLFVIGLFLYAVYAVCSRKRVGDSSRGPGSLYPGGVTNLAPNAPPAPGFRTDFGVGSAPRYDAEAAYSGGQRGGFFSSPFGGFMGGAASGGMLGYLLGSRNRGYEGNRTGSSYYDTPSTAPYSGYRREYSTPVDNDIGATRSASGFGDTTVR